jgi:hypothetical protein
MPVVKCPKCAKQYKLPANAAGQVAKCACGNRFRLAASPVASAMAGTAKAPSTKPAAGASAPSVTKSAASATPSASLAADEDFWNEGLKPVPSGQSESTTSAGGVGGVRSGMVSTAYPTNSKPRTSSEPEKKPKKAKGVRWGFDWGKVAGGLLTFLIAGGITVALVFTTGRLFFWPAGVAIVGLFTALSGLMGEEGIW